EEAFKPQREALTALRGKAPCPFFCLVRGICGSIDTSRWRRGPQVASRNNLVCAWKAATGLAGFLVVERLPRTELALKSRSPEAANPSSQVRFSAGAAKAAKSSTKTRAVQSQSVDFSVG